MVVVSWDDVDEPRVIRSAPLPPIDGTEGFTSWAGEHHRALLAFAELVSGDGSTAEDLVQIALAKVYLKWGRVGRSDEDPLAYVRRIIVNENTSLWRRAWKRRERPTAELPERPRKEQAQIGQMRPGLRCRRCRGVSELLSRFGSTPI